MISSETVNVSGGTFVVGGLGGAVNINGSSNNQSKAFETLAGKVSSRALYDSGETSEPAKCHPGTRVNILDIFITWAMATTYLFPIKWLTGPAGAGKSAIMRSFAEMLAQQGLLLASFFFFRSDNSRNNATRLVSTLVYQICLAIPRIRPRIERAIDLHPLIFTSTLSNQIQTLIINPLLHFFYDPNSITIDPFPRIILIDGLDECLDDETQVEILNAFCEMLRTLPIPIAIIFASRPECRIRGAFDLGHLNRSSSRITLDNTFEPDKDIEKYYLNKFKEIQETHPLKRYLLKIWPSPQVIAILVQNASGQFIYASTVIKFVRSLRHNPSTQLDMVLGLIARGTAKPFQQLDFLYATIFLNIEVPDLPSVLRVLGIILTPPDPESSNYAFQSPKFLEELLGYKRGEIRRLFIDLESLLTVTIDQENIRIFHTSLSDFLFDKSRAENLSLDKADVSADIVSLCLLKHFSSPSSSYMDEYICSKFASSLKYAAPTDSLRQIIIKYDMKALVDWTYGLVMLTPMFLDALQSSAFPDAQTLHTEKVASFRKSLSPRMEIYLSTQTLFSFLMLVLTNEGHDRLEYGAKLASVGIYGSLSGDWLCRIMMSKVWRTASSSTTASISRLVFEFIMEPNGLASRKEARTHCANLVAHLLPFMKDQHDNRGRRVTNIRWVYQLLFYLFKICPVRNDLAEKARDLLSITLEPPVKEAITSYLLRCATPQEFGQTGNTTLNGGSTETSKKSGTSPILRSVTSQVMPREGTSINSNSRQEKLQEDTNATANFSWQENQSLTERQPASTASGTHTTENPPVSHSKKRQRISYSASPAPHKRIKKETREIIDLTADDSEDEVEFVGFNVGPGSQSRGTIATISRSGS